MAEPRLRFKDDNGNAYPVWQEYELDEILTERNEPHLITKDAPQLSFTIEQGVIYPEDKKTNKRDFLMKDKDNKKFLLTEYNDIIYNPANLKFGAIHRNALGRGVVSPIYAIFYTDQNPAFIEGIVTNPKFIKSSLKYLEGTVVKLMTLKPKDFVKMKVWIPCLEEQQKIADFLSSVDEVIAVSEQEVANLETQKKAVMKRIFSQEVRFKREDGTDFPVWEEKPLGSVVGVYDGTHQTPEYVSDGVRFVSVENINDLYGSSKYITQDAFDKQYKNNAPQKGDVLMTRIGDIGTAAVVSSDEQLAYYVSLALLKPSSIITGNYLAQEIAGDFFQNELWIRTLHTAYPKKINKEDIGKCLVQIPCLEEQHLIADFLSDFDEAITAAKKELELWKELKKGLLQQMFV